MTILPILKTNSSARYYAQLTELHQEASSHIISRSWNVTRHYKRCNGPVFSNPQSAYSDLGTLYTPYPQSRQHYRPDGFDRDSQTVDRHSKKQAIRSSVSIMNVEL